MRWQYFKDGSGLLTPSFSGAKATASSTLAVTADAWTTVGSFWDGEEYDVGDWWEAVTNPSRMTVPANVDYIQCSARLVSVTDSADDAAIRFLVNGTDVYGTYGTFTGFSNLALGNVSPIIPVTEGDYVELQYYIENADHDLTTAVSHHFAAWKVEGPTTFYGARLSKSGAQTVPGTTLTDVSWATESFDVGDWFDSGSDAAAFVVPSGLDGYVQVGASIDMEASMTNGMSIFVYADYGSGYVQVAGASGDMDGFTTPNGSMSITSPPIAVDATDKIKIQVFLQDGDDINANEGTYAWLRKIG